MPGLLCTNLNDQDTTPQFDVVSQIKPGYPLDDRLLTLKDVRALLAVSHTYIYKYIKMGEFPKPFHLGKETNSRWRLSEVQAVMDARAAGCDNETLRAVVAKVESNRQHVFTLRKILGGAPHAPIDSLAVAAMTAGERMNTRPDGLGGTNA